MDVKLSRTYELLVKLELSSDRKSLDMDLIENEINTIDEDMDYDIKEYNRLIDELKNSIESKDIKNSIRNLIMLRANEMDLNKNFYNFVDEVDNFFVGSGLSKKLEE